MFLIISTTLLTISVNNFIKCKKYISSMLICMWLWYLVRYVAISPLDPKYLLILYVFCLTPAFVLSFSLNNFVYSLVSVFFKYFMYLLAFVIVLVSSLIMSYFQVYGNFGEIQLLGVLQTNVNESFEGAKLFVGLRFFLYFPIFYAIILLPYIIKNYHFSKFFSQNTYSLYSKTIFFIVSLFIFILVTLMQDFDQKNMMLRLVKSYYRTYKESFEIVEQRKNIAIPDYEMRYGNDNKTIILVIGESATKNHMGAYGYFRDTTPWLSRQVEEGRAILFKNVYSAHALTALTVPLIVSESFQDRFDDIAMNPSVINIFNKMDYNTFWFSNQDLPANNPTQQKQA